MCPKNGVWAHRETERDRETEKDTDADARAHTHTHTHTYRYTLTQTVKTIPILLALVGSHSALPPLAHGAQRQHLVWV